APVRAPGVLWVTGTGLSAEPSRSAHLTALAARSAGDRTVLDLDYRPVLWESAERATAELERALKHATVAVGNLDECAVAVGEREPNAAAEALLARGVRLAVVKQGPAGARARTADGRGGG